LLPLDCVSGVDRKEEEIQEKEDKEKENETKAGT